MARFEESFSTYELYQIEETGRKCKIGENESSKFLEDRIRHLKRLPGNQTLRFSIEKRTFRRVKK